MPADPLAPVARGDDVLTTAFSAAGINAVRAAARRVRDQWPREGPTPGAGPPPCLEVIVRNDTGDDLEAFSVVVIQTTTVVNHVTLPYEFQARPVFAADVPTATTERPAILSEPIPAGEYGRAVVAGHTLCKVQVSPLTYGFEYARPVPGDATQLKLSPGGPVRLLEPTLNSQSNQLTPVVIDDDSVDGWVRRAGTPVIGTGVINIASFATEDVVTLTEPGFYLLFATVSAQIRGAAALAPPTTGDFTYSLFADWAAAQPDSWRCVTQFDTWRASKASAPDFRFTPDGRGSASLQSWVRLTKFTVPYVVRVRWGSFVWDMTQGGSGAWVGQPLGTLVQFARGVIEFSAVRLPGVVKTGGPSSGWQILDLSQPSPPPPPPGGGGGAQANPDDYTVPAGGILDIPSPGVLANDTVPAGYSAALDSQPAYGTLAFNANGSFKYTQSGDLSGLVPPVLDSFTYHLTNGSISSPPTTVTITITGGTTGHGGFAPVFASDGTVVTGSGTGSGSGASTGGGTA